MFAVLFYASPVAAQTAPLRLTLQETIERAQTESPAARIARLGYEAARWDHQAYRAEYLPAFSFNGDAPGLERAINDIVQDDGSVRYVPQSRTFSAASLGMVQKLPFTGGEVFVQSRLSRIDLFGENAGVNQWQASPMVIGFRQPIFQFNAMRWQQRTAPLQFRVAQRTFAENLAGAAVDAANFFFDAYIARISVDRAQFNVAVNDTIYTLSKGRFELGKIAENDLLQSELALLNARTDLSDAQITLDRALQDLKIALALPYDREIDLVAPLTVMDVAVDPAVAVAQARENRSDFLRMQLNRLSADQAVSQAKFSRGFSADLVASYGLNQSGTDLGQIYADPLNSQRFSLGFRVPLYNWGRARAEYQEAVAEREQTRQTLDLQRERLEQEVYFEALQFRQLQQQVALAAKADTIAARRFEVARNRYSIGKIDVTDLFDAQQAKDGASQAYIRTLRQFWVSYFRLRRMTLYDFATGEALAGP